MKQTMQAVVRPGDLLKRFPQLERGTFLSLGYGLGAAAVVAEATQKNFVVTVLDRRGEQLINDPQELWRGSKERNTAPSQYDVIIAYNVFQHLERDLVLGSLLPTLARRLARGGVIDIVVSVLIESSLSHRYSADELVTVLEAEQLAILDRYEDTHGGMSLGETCEFSFVWVRAQKQGG